MRGEYITSAASRTRNTRASFSFTFTFLSFFRLSFCRWGCALAPFPFPSFWRANFRIGTLNRYVPVRISSVRRQITDYRIQTIVEGLIYFIGNGLSGLQRTRWNVSFRSLCSLIRYMEPTKYSKLYMAATLHLSTTVFGETVLMSSKVDSTNLKCRSMIPDR
ncbi:hypothetical protein AVEN_103471-1 [Araneus ventricosus]|uniref:Uncharacterized protein n=1 Tax=Araneus ventricosus TaxID=182803 RepID=A0A4Y2MLX2_ARAVE|nr:hypothetical protein AVEN_103471-1 [Araneus ventricosus]